ncbi:hypothetical protein CAPTEDRAFT_198633 [Capitella teleta]|uniref:Uncharacterized protein n=1 Tax=Capitella teleta TaxID=283909 RepID=R7UYW1_CAPTE|nr:hypothetical protein CAPTEDRAFT_198633 [Capitella teleta]|eukprot:ELU11758.1 hypothetical protein CAPTEDRAFT_198633 [Capitella teleta]
MSDHHYSGILQAEDERHALQQAKQQNTSPYVENETDAPRTLAANNNTGASFADVVRKTVQSTLLDEQNKSQMTISNVDEDVKDVKDEDFIKSICDRIDSKVLPKGTMRLGKKIDTRERPLKVTFETEFDVRPFRSRCDQNKRTSEEFPNIRIRQCRNAEEQKTFGKGLERAKEMNKAAKDTRVEYNFSVLDDGQIWKFEKDEQGKWKRDAEWINAPSGNGG